ncbi:MAG: hypothetical protein ACOX4H_05240 [Bacillota bacterium]|nr:hypothetical protein [Clostridia bacterium]
MTSYQKNNWLPLIISIAFVFGAIPYFFLRLYLVAGIILLLAGLWFISYRIGKRPYVIIDGGKLILSRGIFKPKEYDLSRLTIEKKEKNYLQFSYKDHKSEEKVNILLSAMGKKDGQRFAEDIVKILKKHKGKGSFADI